MPSGGKITALSVNALVSQAYAYVSSASEALGTVFEGWFGPALPEPRTTSPGSQRLFDYLPDYNRRTRPRGGEPFSFETLRRLSDSCEQVRLAIETRKDQMARLGWSIRKRSDFSDDDKRIDRLKDFFLFPDKEHAWDVWLKAFLEDVLVLDAGTLFPRRTIGGDMYSLDLVDGATILPLIDGEGRTPIAPWPAYQQILKGHVGESFSREDLVYVPRNVRNHKVYGYSPVEQVIVTMEILLRRTKSVMDYYTEGNIPEALTSVPEAWTPQMILEFQTYWDYLMSTDEAARRRMKFVPHGVSYTPTRESTLKDEMDETLTRIVCFAFSLPPTPFIRQMNRATAQTSEETSLAEGLGPMKVYVKGVLDRILAQQFGSPDLEWAWGQELPLDHLKRAQYHETYVANHIMTPDEVRAELGRPRLTQAQWKEFEKLDNLKKPPQGAGAAPKGASADPKNSTS